MINIDKIEINNEIIHYIQDEENILVSLNAINIIFGSIKKNMCNFASVYE